MPVVLGDIAIPFQATASGSPVGFWLFLLGLYVAFLLIGLWVYQDARIRGMNSLFWFAIVFLVPVFGLVGDVIYRRDRPLGRAGASRPALWSRNMGRIAPFRVSRFESWPND